MEIPELDGLRGIACLTVVFGHFDKVTERVSYYAPWQAFVTTANASMGVICFFTLSGFLLTYLAVLEFQRTGRFDVRAFYVRRIFRIWPLHFTVIGTVMLLAAPFGRLAIDPAAYQWCLDNIWQYLLFLNNWSLAMWGVGGHTDKSPPMLNISWSIAIEEQIYLIFPAVMLGVLGGSWRRRLAVMGIVLAVAAGYRLFALLTWGPIQPGRAGSIYLGTPTYLDVVMAGGIAGWICAKRRLDVLRGGVVVPGPLPRWLGPVILLGLVGVSLAWRYVDTRGSTYLDVVVYPLMGLVFGAMMLWAAESPRTLFARVLRWRPLRILGTLSFGLYLWHFTARGLAYSFLDPFRPRGQGQIDTLVALMFVTYLALSLLLATLSYVLIERQFLQLRRRLTARRAASVVALPHRPERAARHEAPGPRLLPVGAACLSLAVVGIGLAHLLVRR